MLPVTTLQRSIQIKERPYNLLLFTAILLFIGGFLANHITIDIHLHDSYFIFSLQFLIWSAALILLAFWLLYLGTNQILFSPALSWIHIVLTIAAAIFIFALPYFFSSTSGTEGSINKQYIDYKNFDKINLLGHPTNMLVNAFAFLLLFQLLYFVNFFMGFFRRMRKVEGYRN